MTRVKICGIQRPADGLLAAQAGADFIGLVFVPGRHRRLQVNQAQAVSSEVKSSSGHNPQLVGLFADQPLEEVNGIMKACHLDLAQLCGNEPPEYCGQIQGRVIKVVHVSESSAEETDLEAVGRRIERYSEEGHLVTLDRLVEGLQGGTGRKFDWRIAAGLSQRGHSFLLAGGLSPVNVAEAVAAAQPWGVDVSSGVETDGAKDPEKIRAFIQNARQLSPKRN